MATLTGNTIASTYLGVLNVSGAVGATTLESVTDGAGTATSLSLSQQKAKIVLGTDSGDDFTINNGSADIVLVEGDTNDVTLLDDLILISDSSAIKMGAGADATFTHDGTTGLTIAASPISINSTGDLTLDSNLDIVLDAGGGNFEFKDGGAIQLSIDVAGTVGEIDIDLEVNGDDLVFNQYDGTEVMRITDTARVGIRQPSPTTTLEVVGGFLQQNVTLQSGTGAEDLTGTTGNLIWYATTTQAGDITLPQATSANAGMVIKIIAGANWSTTAFKLGYASGGSTVMVGTLRVSALDAVLTTSFAITANAKNLVIDADAVATAGGAKGSTYTFTYLAANLVHVDANAYITTGTVATTAAASVTGGI